jgi:hypothetical protein
MKNDTYQTSDFWLSATLMAMNEELQDIDRSKGKRAIFIFLQSPTIEEKVENYHSKKILLEPQTLFIQSRLLKSRLYE